jgi:Dolichyl-phosphate-mannose-protein mannosyltransferase
VPAVPGPLPRSARVALALAAAAFLLQCAHGLAVKSGTADELGAHLPSGILYWRSGTFSGGIDNPPLGQLLVAAGPVLAGTADRPLDDAPGHLLPARLPVVLLGLATVLAMFAIGAAAGGPLAGAAAAVAAALSPNLVAHARLATLDAPVTAFAAFAMLLAWRAARRPSVAAYAAFGVAVGTAAAIKFTALHLLPALALGAFLLPGSLRERSARAAALAAAGIAGVLAFAWLAYGAGPARFLLPAPWTDAVLGKWEHGARGHFAYLFGRRSAHGFAAYFLVALLVKTPIPTLLAAGAGAVTLARRRLPGDAAGLAAFVLLPAAWIIAAMSLLHRVDIGVRHVLPALPALWALAGAGVAALVASGRAGQLAAAAMAIALFAAAALTTPDHLAYFHVLAGTGARGDAILIDSNLDWGQDEGRFRRWAAGKDVHVNPPRPVDGVVAANVNAIHGILRADDLRLRWVTRLPVERAFGHTWRVATVDEGTLHRAAEADPIAALDLAWWLTGVGRPDEAITILARNDLSAHPVHGVEWQRVRAEALLEEGRLDEAARAARDGGDADLAAEIAYRDGAPLDDARVPGVVAALARRGRREDARALAVARLGFDPFLAGAPGGGAPTANDIARQKDLGEEATALAMAGERLARVPTDRDALALYGELVVRRKLGLAEYPWPNVDWSGVGRADQ